MKPWEKYAKPAQEGPWARYAPKPAARPPKPAEAPYNATDGESALSLGLAGAGKSVSDTGLGIAQRMQDFVRYQSMGMLGGGDELQQQIDEQRKVDAPLMQTTPGMLGNVAGQVAQSAMLPGGGAIAGSKLLGAAAQQGAFAATQPVATGDSLASNVGMGAALGAAGQGVANVAGRLAKGGSDLIDPAKRALIDRARELGIPVNAAQISDSRFMKTLASVVNKLPLSGGDKAAKRQGTAFTRAAAKTIGEDADALTPEVMASARERIGATFDELGSKSGLRVDETFVGQLKQLVEEAKAYTPDGTGRAVDNIANDLLAKAKDGVIPGEAYQNFSTMLRKLSTGPQNSMGGYISGIQDAMEDALGRSIPGESKAAWKAAREQYRNLKTLEKLVANNDGNVPAAQLLAKLNTGKKTTAYGGGGELGDLARIGKGVLRDPIPNSGTAERGTVLGALGLGGGAGAYYGAIDPLSFAATLGAGAGIGRGLNSEAFSRYLTNGMGKGGRAAMAPARVAPHLLPAAQRAQEERKRKGLLD